MVEDSNQPKEKINETIVQIIVEKLGYSAHEVRTQIASAG